MIELQGIAPGDVSLLVGRRSRASERRVKRDLAALQPAPQVQDTVVFARHD
ncbi:MAG: hypothetical protein AAF383_05110 [Cyanobacteria bacterium P01_A01_bin.83]